MPQFRIESALAVDAGRFWSGMSIATVNRVTVEGRWAPLTALLMPVCRAVFRHRHRRLRSLYGSAA